MKKKTITTIGGATRDIMYYTDDVVLLDNKDDLLKQKLMAFEYGAKIYSQEVYLTFGGGGMNAAVNFSGLGVDTQALLSLGDDLLSQEVLKQLKENKIGKSLVQKKKDIKTGISCIINVGTYNEHVIFAYRGANQKMDLSPKVVKKINTPWIYMTSLSGNFKPGLKNIFDLVTKKNIKLAWNPGSNQLKMGLKGLAKYMEQTTVFDVNRDEALELVMSVKGKQTKNNIKSILKVLHSYGQEITVVTDGHKGAYIYDGQKQYFKPAGKAKGINTTGAGDAFGSSFVAGLIKYKGDIEKSLKLAILNSNAVIMKIGAQQGLLKAKDLKKHNL